MPLSKGRLDRNRLDKEKREIEEKAMRLSLSGKSIKTLNAQERDILLFMIALRLGLVNESGQIQ